MNPGTSDRQMVEASNPGERLRISELALAAAAAVVSAAVMFVLGVAGAVGVYEGGVAMMQEWHLLFEPTVLGTVAGMVEAAVVTFVLVYILAWLYNAWTR